MNDFRSDPWLAGFAAGEACFLVHAARAKGGAKSGAKGFRPRFTIHLRVDDAAILAALRACFGGTIGLVREREVMWAVSDKAGLLALVAYFEEFPLRARKQADFVVWAEAVRLYAAHGYRAAGLAEAKAALEAARVFVPPEIEELPRVTREEVAKLAGVSVRSVERAFAKDAHKLAPETRSKIAEAAQALGYKGGGRQKPQRRLRLVS